MTRSAVLPAAILLAYAIAFASAALGGGLLVFDDHPGQLYRLAHALRIGLMPWRWNPGWWAGYPELQFYPPGFSYLGALLHHASLGALSLSATYQLLLWVTYLLPAITTFALLARVLPNPWLALPGAFLALTLSAGSRSGVEEGLRWGLVAARLGWGLLPLLALSLVRWVEGTAGVPAVRATLLLAAVILTHPAHAPAAACIVLLAGWLGRGAPGRRLLQATSLLLLGCGLAGFWLLPLLAHLDLALPLAWGDASLGTLVGQIAGRPLLLLLAAMNLAAWLWLRRAGSRARVPAWLLALVPATLVLVVLDAAIAQPLGILWLPADRLADSLLLALILGASVALWWLGASARALPHWVLAGALLAISAALSGGPGEATLSLWPRAAQWPSYETVARGVRLNDLWAALAEAPAGRVLFVRSAIPLTYRLEWWRAHSHVTALAPLMAGREILNGTFTHPSPIAGLIYTGSAAHAPITRLVEQRDGHTLFGQGLESISPEHFERLAERLRISVVVALDEDEGRLSFLTDNADFSSPARIGPFRLFVARTARPTPAPAGPGRWRIEGGPHPGGWMSGGVAYSPLWEARAGGRAIPSRRDPLGLLEVDAPGAAALVVELIYRPGAIEWGGLGLSLVSAIGLVAIHTLRRSPG